MNTRTLLERRTALVGEMRSITEKPTGAAGDLSQEQSQRFDALKAELEGLEKRIDRQRLIDEAERRAQGQPLAGTGDQRLDESLRNFSLRRAICSQVPDLAQQIDCGRERELSNEIAKRAGYPFKGMAVPMSIFHMEKRTVLTQQGSPDSGGANLVGRDHLGNELIDVLRAKMVVRRLGARVLSGLQGGVDIPKQSGAAATAWVAEDAALSAGDPGFQKVQMDPKTCGAMSEFSRNMLLQSSPDIEQLMRMDFAAVLANALDVAALNGSGANDPRGVLNLSGLSTVNGPVSWTAILQMIEAVEEANTEGNGWTTTPGMKRLLRSTPKVTSTDSVMVMQEKDSLAGYPLFSTSNVPSTLGSPAESDALIFGDWTDLLIGFWSELDILVNPYESAAYARGNVKVRGMMSVDIAARHVESFVAMTNVSPG